MIQNECRLEYVTYQMRLLLGIIKRAVVSKEEMGVCIFLRLVIETQKIKLDTIL